MSTIVAQICIRRDTAANFTSANPTLALGEIAYETDTRNIKVGTGSTAWTALPYINPFRGGTAAADTSNTIIGSSAGAAVSTGVSNTFVGAFAGQASTGSENTFIGRTAGQNAVGSNFNVGVGGQALRNSTGGFNTALGHNASATLTSGTGTTAVGLSAATLNTASDITAVGANALDANTSGTNNTAVGKDALGGCTTGIENTAIGWGALAAALTNPNNTAVGSRALNLNQGARNTACGSYALGSNTSGNTNTAIGDGSGYLNGTGSGNVFVGYDAGRTVAGGGGNTAPATSIYIGNATAAGADSQSNQIVIGNGAIGNGSNTTTIGNSSTTNTYIPAGNVILLGGASITIGTAGNGSNKGVFARNSTETQSVALVPAAGNDGQSFVGTVTNNPLQIRANLTTRMTVGTDGNVSIANGNLVMSTAGTGIDFSATAHAGGMTSELLSDYEEGTFTPTVSSGVTTPTYNQQTGWYTKVGRMVYFMIRILLTSGTANANHLKFGGLPFTSNSGAQTTAGAHWTFSQNFLAANTSALPNLYISSSSTTVDLYGLNGLTFAGTDANSITNPITIQGFYYV